MKHHNFVVSMCWLPSSLLLKLTRVPEYPRVPQKQSFVSAVSCSNLMVYYSISLVICTCCKGAGALQLWCTKFKTECKLGSLSHRSMILIGGVVCQMRQKWTLPCMQDRLSVLFGCGSQVHGNLTLSSNVFVFGFFLNVFFSQIGNCP